MSDYHKKWWAANRDTQNRKRAESRLLDLEHSRAVNREASRRRRADPKYRDYIRSQRKAWKARRRGRIASQSSPILTLEDWGMLIQAFSGKCAYCGCLPPRLTQDHMIPVSKGGEHTYSNVVPACMRCNQLKADRDIDEFMSSIGSVPK